MPQPSYAYAVARLGVLEGKLLSSGHLERMLQAGSPEAALKVLAETDYAQGVAELKTPQEFEQLLSAELERVIQLINSVTPDPELTNTLLLKYDFHNLKVLLKARRVGVAPQPLLGASGTVPRERLEAACRLGDFRDLPAPLATAASAAEQLHHDGAPAQVIDQTLDRARYEWIFAILEQHRSPFLQGYFEQEIDLINLRTLLRAKRLKLTRTELQGLLLPHGQLGESDLLAYLSQPVETLLGDLAHSDYGATLAAGGQAFLKTGKLTTYERLADNQLLGYVKAHKHGSFGLAPIVGYLLAKETELQAIRIVLVGLINGLESDSIRERLRELYV